MSDYVTDEMVETAARAAYNSGSGGYARAALEAVAPLIAAAALRRAIDAADEAFAQEDVAMTQWGNGYIAGQGAALDLIRNYTNEMEADRE